MSASDFAAHRSVLATSVPLSGLSGAELDQVLDRCSLVEAAEGDHLLDEGMPSGGLFIIVRGAVECYLPAREGPAARPTRVYYRRERAGQCFGELSVLDRMPVSASVRATEATLLCLVPTAAFEEITETSDRIGRIVFRNLLEHVIAWVREKDDDLSGIEFV